MKPNSEKLSRNNIREWSGDDKHRPYEKTLSCRGESCVRPVRGHILGCYKSGSAQSSSGAVSGARSYFGTSPKRISAFLVPLFSALALAAPFAYTVVKDGAPESFEKLVREAFAKWQAVPSTTLKIDAPKAGTPVQFRWGGGEIELNPDLSTRTMLETSPDGKESAVVSINPEATDLESALLLETGLRLGLPLEPSWEGKRTLGEADITLLRQQYAPNGDLTADGKVNIDDFELFAREYGKSQTAGGIKGDFNGDGKVDIVDFEILKGNYDFGKQPGLEEPKPAEPTTPAPTEPKPTTPAPTEPKPAEPAPVTPPTK